MQKNNELAPWQKADLPEPPMPRGLSWIGVCGPGVIVLGVSIGSGEFLLGPAIFVKHGLSLLWVTLVAVFFQTVFNTELMRYTVATGEPVVTGFMRTRPGKTFWAWFYAVLYFLQIGWPAWAATAAGAIFFLFAGRLAAPPADATTIYLIGIVTFLACVGVLLVGKRIARTLEVLNWVLVACILGSFLVLGIIYVPGRHLVFGAGGFTGFDTAQRRVQLPARSISTSCCWARWWAIRAAAACSTSRCRTGRATRATAWAAASGTSPARWAARRCSSPTPGFMFEADAANMARWRGWWRIVRVDQWGIFFVGALLGMMLPALLYVTFVARGTDIKGLAISAVLAQTIGATAGAVAGRWSSRFSARGSCSRPSSTAWKA